jgi:aldehyde:ferredoxin oxidoreductase
LILGGVESQEAKNADCLNSVGYATLAERLDAVSSHVQKLRWRTRLRTGFHPHAVSIPKRFLEVETWRGRIDGTYLDALRGAYGKAILGLAHDPHETGHEGGPPR